MDCCVGDPGCGPGVAKPSDGSKLGAISPSWKQEGLGRLPSRGDI